MEHHRHELSDLVAECEDAKRRKAINTDMDLMMAKGRAKGRAKSRRQGQGPEAGRLQVVGSVVFVFTVLLAALLNSNVPSWRHQEIRQE